MEDIIQKQSYECDDCSDEVRFIVLWCEEEEMVKYYGNVIGFIKDGVSFDMNRDGYIARRIVTVGKWEPFDEPIHINQSVVKQLQMSHLNSFSPPNRRLKRWIENQRIIDSKGILSHE